MIGNKIDLIDKNENKREVAYEEADNYAIGNNLNFYETSAFTNFHINEVFQELMESKKMF